MLTNQLNRNKFTSIKLNNQKAMAIGTSNSIFQFSSSTAKFPIVEQLEQTTVNLLIIQTHN